VYEGLSDKPWNRGTALHMLMGPREANCPKASSMKKRGIPHMSNMMT